MAPSSFSPNERLLRKRLAARLRQRRCRERKRELIMSGIVAVRGTGGGRGVVETTVTKSDSSISVEGATSADNSTGFSSSKSTPASSPSKVDPVYVNIQHIPPRGGAPQGGYSWTYPMMPPIPRNNSRVSQQRPHSQANVHHSQSQAPVPQHSNGGYYVPPPHHPHQQHYHHHHQPSLVPMMYPHHPHHPYMAPHPSHLYPPQQRGSGCGHGGPPLPYPPAAFGPPPPSVPEPPTADTTTNQGSVEESSSSSLPGDVSRTVSRSPSDASMHSGKAAEAAVKAEQQIKEEEEALQNVSEVAVVSVDEEMNMDTNANATTGSKKLRSKKGEKPLLKNTEKAAVAAMLAMKTSSDESDGDSSSVSASAVTTTNKRVTRTNQQAKESTTQHQALNSMAVGV